MSPSVATIVCWIGIAGLFYLDRDKSPRTSKALWLPVIWLWIIGSRAASDWLWIWFRVRFGAPAGGLQGQIDGSPTDAFIFAVLLAAGLVTLSRRSRRASALLKANFPILIYFAFCLLSLLWAPLAEVGFKRWIKALGDPVMALIVATEGDPIASLRRVFSRVGFVLFPLSVLMIKYSDLGHGYDPDGTQTNTGVTTNKNSLGLIVFVISLGALWSFLQAYRNKRQPARTRQLVARGTLLAFGIMLLTLAHSATAVACFGLGGVLILATHLAWIKRRPGRVHALVMTILAVGGLAILFGGEGTAVHALGRQTTLTGRTEIWAAIIPQCPNALIGAGFENFWIGPTHDKVIHSLSGWWHIEYLNEAHNGYIETYLNLGLVGLGLIVLILLSGYRHASAALRRNPETAGLMLAYVAAASIYSITEAGFRMLSPMWNILMLAVVGASGVVADYGRREALKRRALRADREGDPVGSSLSPLIATWER